MKKTNIKRFFVLFCVLACVFSMTACTNTISSDSAKTSLKDMKVNQYASDMVQWAEDMLVYLDQTSDAQIKADGEAAKTLSYVNGKVYVVNMQGMNDKTIEFYNSWVKTREDLGALKSIDKEDVRVSGETGILCTIAINATYETRTCAFELVIDDDFNLDSGAINPTYTTGEKMEKAVLNTVLGMGTVFIVLIFISYIISLLQHVNKIGAKKQTAEEPQQTAPAPVVEEPEDFSKEKETSHFMKKLADDLSKEIKQLEKKPVDKLLDDRYEKYRKIGRYSEYSEAVGEVPGAAQLFGVSQAPARKRRGLFGRG